MDLAVLLLVRLLIRAHRQSFCSGEEITVTVMPPGDYEVSSLDLFRVPPCSADLYAQQTQLVGKKTSHWALPIVTRFGHTNGVAPYNGVVAVTANSRAITQAEFDADEHFQLVTEQCELVGKLCGSFAPIRIDARRVSEVDRRFMLFDVNMKPVSCRPPSSRRRQRELTSHLQNATGPGRPGRDQQASLTLIAANRFGWDYPSLLRNVLRAAKPFKALRR